MGCFFALLLLLIICIAKVQAGGNLLDVRQFGAVADAKSDNAKAFLNAWTKACESEGYNVVHVPFGTFMVGPVVFAGPCKATNIDFVLKGVLKAPDGSHSFNQVSWLTFQYVNGLTLTGGGTLDGQGPSAWRFSDCATNPHCVTLPTSLTLNFVTNSYVNQIKSINSKRFHMHVFKCSNVWFDGLTITAPWNSPNTDGVHIAVSSNIHVTHSNIGTGDDCISVGPGTQFLNISRVFCGPGHGISIGSLGNTPNEAPVSSVSVTNCTFTGTTNGLRIKTWAPSSPGLVEGVTFGDIFMKNAGNPIIIDQHYCPNRKCDSKASSAVEIKEVRFRKIWGYSSTQVAVDLQCSRSRPCQGIELKDINIKYAGRGGATSVCDNANGVHYGVQIPPSCI